MTLYQKITRVFSGSLPGPTLGALLLSFPAAPAAEAPWKAAVSHAGLVKIELSGEEAASIAPGLFEVSWRAASMGEGLPVQPTGDGVHRGHIRAPGGSIVEVESQIEPVQDGAQFTYRLTPKSEVKLNSLHVSFTLPSSRWAGGTFQADGRSGAFPAKLQQPGLLTAPAKELRFTQPGGATLQLSFPEATPVLVQDDRLWGPAFSIRIGPQMGETVWPAGKSLALAFALRTSGGLHLEVDAPVTIQAGPDWVPLENAVDIEPGSALDFSQVIPRETPAGAAGRVVVTDQGHFALAQRPEKAVRFYGVNLCFSAQYIAHDVADRLAERLWRLGYNAVRIHHYEGELVDPSASGIRLKPEKLDQLDYLFAALKRRGMYMTTDLFVSRPVPAARIYPGTQGKLGMDEYKMAVHVNERAFEDFKDFSRSLLDHVNPYTQMRYADDPALAWLSLVNEDNPGNFTGSLKGPLREDWQRAWNRWLAKRYPSREALLAALGKLPEDQDPARGTVPLQNVYAGTPAATMFNVFLAEVERDFFQRTRRFLREELHCAALLTDLNAWTNPVQLQAVRKEFDYVDDHFYVDHPHFLDQPWRLPSSCSNASPIAGGATGGRPCAFTRLFGKPFTITEFNYSSPGRFRGVGGILTGALGALQDWDGVWRFAFSHSRDNLVQPSAMNYFDVASDPLNLAAERASLCLFLRGDLAPANPAVSLHATTEELLGSPVTSRDKTPPWHGLAWLTRVGWTVDGKPGAQTNPVTLPISGAKSDPFAEEAGGEILAALRERGWLPPANRTDCKANRFQSATGEVTIDAPENILTLDTPRTAGGFAPAGKRIVTQAATIEVRETDATVWVSSLDGLPIRSSRRLLITHLTDLQNTGTHYADRARKILLAWGKLPHLVQSGRAEITLHLDDPAKAVIYELASSGKRLGELADVRKAAATLTLPLSVSAEGKARMFYEVEMRD